MSTTSATSVPIDVLTGPNTPNPANARTTAAIHKTAEDFEAAFLSSMLQPIFSQLPTDGMFGGGQGEATFRSFMVDAMSKQMVRAGGVGLADTVQRQMLRMQGLTEQPVDPAASTAAATAAAGAAQVQPRDAA